MVMTRDQNAGKNNTKMNNIFMEGVKEFRYLGKNLMHQNSIQEKAKCRLKSEDICILFDPETFVFQASIQNYKE